MQLKNDPQKWKKLQQKRRKEYFDKAEKGIIKKRNQMTEEELNKIRNRNREAARRSRKKKYDLRAKMEIDEQGTIPEPKQIKTGRGRKRIRRREDSKIYRKNQELQRENEKLRRQLNNRQKNLSRKKITEAEKDPKNKIVKQLIGKEKVNSEVANLLYEGEILKQNIKTAYINTQSYKEKEKFRSFFSLNGMKLNEKNENYLNKIIPRVRKKNPNFMVTKYVNIRKIITNFYENNSRLRPGKKDYITKNKIKKQTSYLNAPLTSLYTKYCNEEKDHKISFSYFAKLRPFWIIPPKISARDTCLCVTHENMNLLVYSLGNNDIISGKKIDKVIESIVCEPNSEKCMLRKCSECKSKKIMFNPTKNKDDTFCYDKWITRKENRISAKTKKEISVQLTLKEKVETTIKDIEKTFESKLLFPFMAHVQRKDHQYKVTEDRKKSLSECDLYILMDWSENYQCKYASEPQAVHFGASKEMVSLHTGMIYTKNYTKGFCTFSKCLRHDSSAIIAHLIPVIDYVLQKFPQLNTIHFQSDGPSTQYRNKNMFWLMTNYFPETYSTFENVIYNYSEAGHGKGPADGIGGVLKRTADSLVAHGRDINNYDTLVQELSVNSKNVFIATVKEEDIIKIDEEVPNNLQAFIGSMKVHQFKWSKTEPHLIRFNEMSCYVCDVEKECIHYHLGALQISTPKKVPNRVNKSTRVSTRKRTSVVYQEEPESPKKKRVTRSKKA